MEADQPIVRARDLMERDVITVSPETRLLDVHRLFVEEEIHGAPVVDEDALVCGVISTLDLIRVVRDELEPGANPMPTTYFRSDLSYVGPDWPMPEDLWVRMRMLTAGEAMTRELVTVEPDATVTDIARTMLEHQVHRVLVCDRHTLLGVLTTFDLMRVLVRLPPIELPTGAITYTGYAR